MTHPRGNAIERDSPSGTALFAKTKSIFKNAFKTSNPVASQFIQWTIMNSLQVFLWYENG